MISFRLRVILGIALVETLVLIGLVGASLHFLRVSNEQSFTERYDAEAEELAVLLRDAVVSSDLAALDALAQSFMSNGDSRYLRIRDNQRVLVDRGASPEFSAGQVPDRPAGVGDDGVFDVQKVIYVDEFPVGYLEMGTATTAFNRLFGEARDRLILIALIALLLVVATSWLIGVVLTRDLRSLRDGLTQIGQGRTDLLLEGASNREFRDLAQAFNQMARALAQREQERDLAVAEANDNAQRLALRERRQALLLDTVTDGVLIIDPQLQIVELNQAAERTLGVAQGALIGQQVTRLLAAEDDLQRLRDSLLALDQPDSLGARWPLGRVKVWTGDGGSIWVELSLTRLWEQHSRSFVLAFRDLTPELASQRELERRERLREALSIASIDAILVLDAEGRIVEANPSAARMFQQRLEQLRGRPLLEALRLIEGEAGLLEQLAREQPDPQALELSRQTLLATRGDGEQLPLSFTLVPVHLGEQRLVTLVLRDLSERKRAEQGLLQAKEAAEKANQAKSDFLAHVTHEIRSPLNAMMGCVELLSDTELDHRQRLYSESAQQSASVLLGLINNILDFARIESGALELVHAPFDLVELCESVLALKALQLSDRVIDLGMLYDPALPRQCLGDEARLRQVLVNLIDNAIKFTREGGVVLQLGISQGPQRQFRLDCAVRDSGIGIPQAKQAAIFEAFTQVDSTDATLHGGVGLGLSICHRLVEAMGGSIRLDSAEGQGSTFSFSLPLGVAEEGQVPAPLRGSARVIAANAIMGEALCQQLRLFGLRAETAAHLHEALAQTPRWLFVDAQQSLGKRDCQQLHAFREGGGQVLLMADRKWLAEAGPLDHQLYSDVLEKPLRYSRLCQLLVPQAVPVLPGYGPESRGAGRAGRHGRILLAEDSPANQLVALSMLEQAGYQVALAANGHEVLALLAQQAFDLILMDVRMPRMDGLEATRRIRESAADYAAIPIIALTANALREDTLRCRAVGMNGFVGKPFSRESLVQAIDAGLAQREYPDPEVPNMAGLKLMDEAVLARLAAETSEAMLERMIGLFVGEAQRRMDAIQENLAKLDCHGVEDQAHTLKSNAATFGASQLSALAREIESACKRMDQERVVQLLPETSDTLRETLALYRQRFNITQPA